MRLNHITLASSDVERSARFYTHLGLTQIVADYPDYARFLAPQGDTTLSLHRVERVSLSSDASIHFEVDNVDQTVVRLEQAGLGFACDPVDQPYLWREAILLDPDGHRIFVYHAGDNRLDPPWRLHAPPPPTVFCFELPEGQRLRPLEESDAQELHAVVEANRDHLSHWMPWAAGQTLADTSVFIRRTRGQLASNNGFQTAVIEHDRIVGIVGFHGVSWLHRSASIGYWLAASAQGRGTMTCAVRALLDHAFGTWRLNRVEIRAAVENARSRALAERLGFNQEGILREAELVGDRYVDQVLYALLAEQWATRD